MTFLKNILFTSLLVVACAKPVSSPTADAPFIAGEVIGILDQPLLINEASGLAASHTLKGLLWTHNDSGDEARVFLIDQQAKHISTVYIPNATNCDWEDMAISDFADGSYLYLADIGDNAPCSTEIKHIYRIKEPVTIPNKRAEIMASEIISFQLPDGRRDAETLLIDHQTKDLYILSKREDKVHLYQLSYPQALQGLTLVKFIAELPFTWVVAGDVSPDNREILLKDMNNVYYWKRNTNESIADALQRMPQKLPYTLEPQGEAIAFSDNYSGYYTLSEEGFTKIPPKLYWYERSK